MPYIRVRDTDLFYQERGSGPLAIFLHGFMMDHTLWLDQMTGLANKRRCVTIDQRGFGRSDPIAVNALDLNDYADDVDALITALGEESADIVGFSIGGAIALLTWDRHPERVRSLSILSTGFAPPGPPPPTAQPGERGTPQYLEGNAHKAVFQGNQTLFIQFNDYIFGPSGGRASLMARARYKSMFENTRTDMKVATFRTMQQSRDLRPDVRASRCADPAGCRGARHLHAGAGARAGQHQFACVGRRACRRRPACTDGRSACIHRRARRILELTPPEKKRVDGGWPAIHP